jgi:hypothetical protein
MKEINLFGELQEMDIKKDNKRLTIKEKFRTNFGYDSSNKCKTCKFLYKGHYHNKTYYKCEKMGITHSTATDVRLKDDSCSLYVILI